MKNKHVFLEKYSSAVFIVSAVLFAVSLAALTAVCAACCPAYMFFGYIKQGTREKLYTAFCILTAASGLCLILIDSVRKKLSAGALAMTAAVQIPVCACVICVKLYGMPVKAAYFLASVFMLVSLPCIGSVLCGIIPARGVKSSCGIFSHITAFICVFGHAFMIYAVIAGKFRIAFPFLYLSPVLYFLTVCRRRHIRDRYVCISASAASGAGLLYHMIYYINGAPVIVSAVQTVMTAVYFSLAAYSFIKGMIQNRKIQNTEAEK